MTQTPEIAAAFQPLQVAYQEYLDEFDPTPQFAGEDYNTPLDFDEWMLSMEEGCNA